MGGLGPSWPTIQLGNHSTYIRIPRFIKEELNIKTSIIKFGFQKLDVGLTN